MDWLSFIFIMFAGGSLIYTGLGMIWLVKYVFGTVPDRAFVRMHIKGLLLAIFLCTSTWALLLVFHITGVITMWRIGYALS